MDKLGEDGSGGFAFRALRMGLMGSGCRRFIACEIGRFGAEGCFRGL